MTDGRVLKYFSMKRDLSRRKARWLEFLGQCGITKLTLARGEVQVLGDVPSRAPHVTSNDGLNINNTALEVDPAELPAGLIEDYLSDQTFKDIYDLLRGEEPTNQVSNKKTSRLILHFETLNDALFYIEMVCVPQANVCDVMQLAHDNKPAGHLGYTKALVWIKKYRRKFRSSNVSEYCRRCTVWQQKKEGRAKPFEVPQPQELSTGLWNSLTVNLETHLPETDSGYDCITTVIARCSKRIRLILSRGTDTATTIADSFFENIFRLHGLPDSLVSHRNSTFTSKI